MPGDMEMLETTSPRPSREEPLVPLGEPAQCCRSSSPGWHFPRQQTSLAVGTGACPALLPAARYPPPSPAFYHYLTHDKPITMLKIGITVISGRCPETGPEIQHCFARGSNKLLKVTYDLSLLRIPDSDTASPREAALWVPEHLLGSSL